MSTKVAATALTIAATATLAPAAFAAHPSCGENRICMWEDASYQGSKYFDVTYPGAGKTQEFEIDGWDGDNEISSLINNTPCNITLRDADLDDQSNKMQWYVDPQESYADLKYLVAPGGQQAVDRTESVIVRC